MPDISIGRLRGGFCVYWRDDEGQRRRHQLKARTRKEAEAEGLDVFREKTRQPHGSTVSAIWDAYRESLGERPTAKTLHWTGKAILPHFGHLRPDQISLSDCKSYEIDRLSGGISQGSIHTELGHLRSALRFGKKSRMIDAAPEIPRPAKPETDKRILNAGEARTLIEAAHDPHIRLAIIMLLGTAGRVGAVLDLEWSRVDFDRGVINLRLENSATRKGRAVVPMNSMTRAALSVAKDMALSDYVIEYAGGPVKSIRKGFMNAVARAGIGHVRIHDIRHTAAVTMLAAGHKIEMVAQVLGHSNTAVTFRTYGRYLPQHMSPAVDVLDFTRIRRA